MIKTLKNTLTFDLYKNNREQFRRWLHEKRVKITGHFAFWLICWLLFIVLGVATLFKIDNVQEISVTEYNDVITDGEYYAEKVPAYYPMLQKAYDDGIITNGEYYELQGLISDYWREEEIRRLAKAKKDLEKQLK